MHYDVTYDREKPITDTYTLNMKKKNKIVGLLVLLSVLTVQYMLGHSYIEPESVRFFPF